MIGKLRKEMETNHVGIAVFDHCDPHLNEYLFDHYRTIEALSGFRGSAGTLLVTPHTAALITDSRYFIQADRQLYAGIELLKDSGSKHKLIKEFIAAHYTGGLSVAFDAISISAKTGSFLVKTVHELGGEILNIDFMSSIWDTRPIQRFYPIWCPNDFDESVFDMSAEEKLCKLRRFMSEKNIDIIPMVKLDDIMWLFNLRGRDILCNPLAFAYCLITLKKSYIFVADDAVTYNFAAYMKGLDVLVFDYDDFYTTLESQELNAPMLCAEAINFSVFKIVSKAVGAVKVTSPFAAFKAVKAKSELDRLQDIFLKDSVAVTKFIYWLKEGEGSKIPQTESTLSDYLDHLRRNIRHFWDLSFETISAYGANAAIVHYNAKDSGACEIKRAGMLLVDSGGQYIGGTTDVTRSIVLGSMTDEEKCAYTACASGLLALQNTVIPNGTIDCALDAIARAPIWEAGFSYGHGTGHGIGYWLCVHEEGVRIAPPRTSGGGNIITDGMVFSIEPGIYKEDQFGVRLENVVMVNKITRDFMKLTPLTKAPLDPDGITPDIASKDSAFIRRWNAYQEDVYKSVSPFLDENERVWLRRVTNKITS